MTARCRDGHASTDADYCSVCGLALSAPSPAASPAVPRAPAVKAVPGGEVCPECGEPRASSQARFCEVCRFDFVAGVAGPPPGAAIVEPVAVAAAAWVVVVSLDPALDTDPDPATPFPGPEPERTFALDLAESLVGRRDDQRDIKPEIPVNDPGASRRHAKLLRNADGTVSLQDLASVNGTKVNGHEVPPGTRRALQAGDEVSLGRWTRMTLRARS